MQSSTSEANMSRLWQPMYLITRGIVQATPLITKFSSFNIKLRALDYWVIEPDYLMIKELDFLIAGFTQILFTSPTACDLAQEYLSKIPTNTKVITVGEASYLNLAKFKLKNINYPKKSSGINGVFDEGLVNLKERLLIIGGNQINFKLKSALSHSNYYYLSIYKHLDNLIFHQDEFKKILINQPIKGIIITSSKIAASLVNCANSDLAIKNKLEQISLITIHAAINNELLKLTKPKIFQTSEANIDLTIDLIRKINYE